MDTSFPIFRKELQTRFGSNPSGATLSAYVATILFAQVVEQDPKIRNARDFYSVLARQTEVRTVDGALPIVDRNVKFPLVVRVMKDGKAVIADSP